MKRIEWARTSVVQEVIEAAVRGRGRVNRGLAVQLEGGGAGAAWEILIFLGILAAGGAAII